MGTQRGISESLNTKVEERLQGYVTQRQQQQQQSDLEELVKKVQQQHSEQLTKVSLYLLQEQCSWLHGSDA